MHVRCYHALKRHLGDAETMWKIHRRWKIELGAHRADADWVCQVAVHRLKGPDAPVVLGQVAPARTRDESLARAEAFARHWIDEQGR